MNANRTTASSDLATPALDQVTRTLSTFRQGEVLDVPWLVRAIAAHSSLRLLGVLAKVVKFKTCDYVVVTQTCDIARSSDKRPYLQLAPLIRVSDPGRAKRYGEGETPQYVAVPEAGSDAFADLDRIMTLDKSLAVNCSHYAGVGKDIDELRRFGQAVGRKFDRYPFPNNFVQSVRPLRQRVLERWDKPASPEGTILADLVQIRVEPVPVEEASETGFTLAFIMKQGSLPILADPPAPSPSILRWLDKPKTASEIAKKLAETPGLDDKAHLFDKLAEAWAGLCQTNDVVRQVTGLIVSEDEYALSDYWQSERLDLDQLSGPVTSG